MNHEKNGKCLIGGCEGWRWSNTRDNYELVICCRCAFNPKEAARREKIPMELCEDGLLRKIIRRTSND